MLIVSYTIGLQIYSKIISLVLVFNYQSMKCLYHETSQDVCWESTKLSSQISGQLTDTIDLPKSLPMAQAEFPAIRFRTTTLVSSPIVFIHLDDDRLKYMKANAKSPRHRSEKSKLQLTLHLGSSFIRQHPSSSKTSLLF